MPDIATDIAARLDAHLTVHADTAEEMRAIIVERLRAAADRFQRGADRQKLPWYAESLRHTADRLRFLADHDIAALRIVPKEPKP